MKNKSIVTLTLSFAIAAVSALAMWGQSEATKLKRGNDGHKDTSSKIAIAYVESRHNNIPDPNMFTHLIYAFTEFNDDNDNVVIDNPNKLQKMADLKKQNPNLKVMIGLGGYKREGFSEMTRDKKKRNKCIKNIKHIIDSLGLDGVDLDWEFPTTERGGHTANPKDAKNYVTFVKELRNAIGKDKWISYYSDPSAAFIDHKKMLPYVDYVNVSGYNLHVPKDGETAYHHSVLYPSKKTGSWCVSKSVERHINKGIPKEKILIGIPFYGRGKSPLPTYLECKLFSRHAANMKPVWDNDGQVPYFADKDGNLLMGFDDERSIAAKFDFIRANDMPGVFVWNYDADFDDHRLGKTIQKLRK